MPSFPDFLFRKRILVVLLYLFAASYVFGIWVWSADTPTTAFNSDPRSKLSELIYGTAHKPYVHRVLVPLLTQAVCSVISGPSLDSLELNALQLSKVQKETARLGWETDFFAEYMIALTFAFAALVAFPFAVRKLWSTLYETTPAVTNFVPLIALLALPPIFPTGPHYIYDLPALLLFTLGLLLLIEQRWALFYSVFVLGCLNKETMLLLVPLFGMLYWRKMPKTKPVLHLSVMTLLFALIKTVISIAFSANQGDVMDFHLYLNLHILLTGYSWPTFVIGSFMLWLVCYDYSNKHGVLRKSMFLVIPVGFLVLVSGVITELRAVYELYPIVLLLALHTVFFTLMKSAYRANPFPVHPEDSK